MLLLARAWLCPGTGESGPHITENARRCECGNTNLASLARILGDETECTAKLLEIPSGESESEPEFSLNLA